MLTLTVPGIESFDEKTSTFVKETPDFVLELEHSLVSLSKWEAIWEKPFLTAGDKTPEESFSYIECMVLNHDSPRELLLRLRESDFQKIRDYINMKMTATWFSDTKNQRPSRESVTSELIYYWMASLQIPWEAQEWHLGRLITLIRVFGAKNGTQKKMSRSEIAAQNRALNEKRKRELGTSG